MIDPRFAAPLAILACAAWGWWARRWRQYRRPQQDRELAQLLWQWLTRLPWGPLSALAAVAAASLLTGSIRSGVTALGILVAVGLVFMHISVRRLFWLEWIEPTYLALLGIPELKLDEYRNRAGYWVDLTTDWQWHRRTRVTVFGHTFALPSRHRDGINIRFPLNLRHYGTVKENIVTQIETVLKLRDVDYHWHDSGRRSQLRILPAKVVPTRAPFRNPDIRRSIETALTELPTAPVLALGRGDAPVAIDLDTDAPHILISAGTIGGKSTTIRNIIAQLLWADDDAVAVILDKKEDSQKGLAAVPGVLYAWEEEQMNAALVAVWEEVQRRNAIRREIPLGKPLPKFPRLVLGLEEMNVTVKQLNAWWKKENGTRAGQAPGIYALDNILCMGRASRVNVILDGQAVNNRSTGGDAGAVNIAVRILAEYDENTWRRLAHGAEWIQPISHKVQKGWCVIVHGREVTEAQRIGMSDEQAYRWLTARGVEGRAEKLPSKLRALPRPAEPSPPAARRPDLRGFSVRPARVASTQGMDTGSVIAGTDGEVDYMTLRQAVDEGVVPMRLDSLQRAARRPGFPPVCVKGSGPDGHEYSRAALDKWHRDRKGNPGVYVLRPPHSAAVKIGYTINLEQRLDSLSLHPKTVVRWWPCPSRLAAQRLEAELHERFDEFRDEKDREWFVLDDCQLPERAREEVSA